MNNQKKAVYFNLDGTLIQTDIDYEELYRNCLKVSKIPLEDHYGIYTDEFFSRLKKGSENPMYESLKEVGEKAGIKISDSQIDRFCEEWIYRESNSVRLKESVSKLLSHIPEEVVIAIFTNGVEELQKKKLVEADIMRFTDKIIVSSEIGVAKPDKSAFEKAKSITKADTHVMVSHKFERDLLPAKESGFETILMETGEVVPNDTVNLVTEDFDKVFDYVC